MSFIFLLLFWQGKWDGFRAVTVGDLGETGRRLRHVSPNDLANMWIDLWDGL